VPKPNSLVAASGRVSRVNGPAAETGAAYAVSQQALYVLPGQTPISFPHLGTTGDQLRNAGFATSATLAPDGRLVVFTWVEQRSPPPQRELTHHVYAETWTGSGWEEEDLTASPVFGGDVRDDRVTAAAYCATGELWLATASGRVASRDASQTWALEPGSAGTFDGIVDAACDAAGTLWMATEAGLLEGTVATGLPVRIYAPFTYRP
jgi:hypothetical protein